MSKAIETRDLAYRAGKSFEIHDLNLNVPSGALYGFLGPNGSGKTTTIRLLLNLIRPHAGQITVLGADARREAPRILARTGYVPERPHLYPTFTVAESIRYHAAFYPTWDSQWANELLHTFQLPPSGKVQGLSKGETGKLMMLLALAQRPDLLVLDEPTDGLDPVQRDQMLELIRRCGTEFGIDVLLSSHLLEEVERVCDAVVILGDGLVVANGSIEELRGVGSGLIIEVDGDPRPLAAALGTHGLTASVDASRVIVETSDDHTLDLVRDCIAELGLPLRKLQPRRLSLEDVFLGLSHSPIGVDA